MNYFFSWLRERRSGLILAATMVGVFAGSFALYHLPPGAVAYPAGLCACMGIAYVSFRFYQDSRKHRALESLRRLPENMLDVLLEYDRQDDRDYRALVSCLLEAQQSLHTRDRAQLQDMLDYYTTWVHQIKTPIAAMQLTLQNEDTPLSRRLSDDLTRIEQYVEMVLAYLRLDSESTDYVFREYPLDQIVRQAVRKFAGQFIGKGLRLEYASLDLRVVTDEKWLLFVLQQVLSNSLKYTAAGGISIYMEAPATLCVRDTGIGIAPEDLPRIFEKGYTGYNGRRDKKASGLGLFLCRQVCKNLGHDITAESVVGKGTIVRIGLMQNRERPE